MRGRNENKQTIHDHYVQKYNLREPKILLYDLSQVVDINSFKRADLQFNCYENGCNISMDDDIPLKYLLQTKSEKNGMTSTKNIRFVLPNIKPMDGKISNNKNKTLHFKKRNIKSLIYKFNKLQHKLYKIINLKLICRKCDKICYSFECFEKHCASKHNYALRKHLNLEPSAASKEISQNSCAVCFKSFKNYCELRKHVKRKHDLKLNHKCEICEQNYRSKTLLKLHLRKHELKTQIPAETQFEISTELYENIHEDVEEVHHFLSSNVEQEMNFNEEVHLEKDSFKDSKVKRIHVVYLCTLCSKTFQLESELIKHRQVLKCSFTCDECGHLFRRHYRIQEHMIKYHKHLYNPIKKIRQIKTEKQYKKVENNEMVKLSKNINSAVEAPTKQKLKEIKIIIRKTSIEECNNRIKEIEKNNNISNSIEKAEPISRKHKSSHSSRLLLNPLNKHFQLPINKEISNNKQIPVKNNVVTAEHDDVLPENVRSKRRRNSSKIDIKENLSINTLLKNDSILFNDKSEKNVNPIARELRERNVKSKVKDVRNDNIEIPIRRRSTRLSSHKAESSIQNDEILLESKQDSPAKASTQNKSVAELKKEVSNGFMKKQKTTKRQSTNTNLPKRTTRKPSRANREENTTVNSNTLSEKHQEVPSFTDKDKHSNEEKRKIKAGNKITSLSRHICTPSDEIVTVKDEIVTQPLIEIEVPLFKDGNLRQLERENLCKVKPYLTENYHSGKKSVEQDINVVMLEKSILVSIPKTDKQPPLLTPEEINALIKKEPLIKEEIINFNEYIGPTTGNTRHKYKCLICDRTFGNYNNALRHVGFKHFNKYPCILCPESFAEERQLKTHKEQEHTHKSFTLIPDSEIKTSPHRDEDVDPIIHEDESFESNSLSFDVQNEILPETKLKSSPCYEPDPTVESEHINLLDEGTLFLDMTKDVTTLTYSEQKKSISLKPRKNLIQTLVKNSPQLEVYQIPLPIGRSENQLTRLERTYSPLKSSELFCSEYEEENIQRSERTVPPDPDFKTNSSQPDTKHFKFDVCSETETASDSKREKITEIEESNGKISADSGTATNNDLQINDNLSRHFQSTDFFDEPKKQLAEEKVDSGIGIGEKDFELPENLYKGWFETKSIDPSDEISFDNNNEVTFSEVGIEFA